jgi:hypothetical protein
MKNKIAPVIVSAFILCLIVCILAPRSADSARSSCREEVEKLMRDVHSLNLINSLYLSVDQTKKLLPLVQEAARLRKEIDSLIESKGDQFAEALREIRAQLVDSVDLTDAVKQNFEKMKGPVEREMVEAEESLNALADEAYNVLTDNQRLILSEYKPCIIPQRSVANPERIGQVGGGDIIVELLEKVREIPDEQYPQAKQRIMEMASHAVKIHFKDESDRAETLRRLSETMDKVRTMSQVDFDLKKSEMANAIPAKEIAPAGKQKMMHDRRFIIDFILNPSNADILEQRINRPLSQ